MRHLSLAAVLGLIMLAGSGEASAQINQCNNGNGAAGTVVGAIVGGTTGGLIANNRRGFRGNSFRGFRGSGFRGRGFSSFRGRRGNTGLGIALGALAGGVVGNQIASARSRNCFRQQQTFSQNHNQVVNNQGLSGGPIDHNARRLGDPYGGRSIASQSTVATSPTTTQQGQSSGVFQPVCQNVNRETRLPDGHLITEAVEYCQFSPGGEWIQR